MSLYLSPPFQEVLVWLTKLQKDLGGEVNDDQLREFIWNTLSGGQVSFLKASWYVLGYCQKKQGLSLMAVLAMPTHQKYQCLSQDLEIECPKLAIVIFLTSQKTWSLNIS